MWDGTTQGHKYQEEIVGAILGADNHSLISGPQH